MKPKTIWSYQWLCPFLLCLAFLCNACEQKTDGPDPSDPASEIVFDVDPELVEQLVDVLIPLVETSTLDFDALPRLNEFADAQVVGLGEATHGTREFFEIKVDLAKYLIREKGFRIILFEMDFAEAMFFNEFIHGENSDPLSDLMDDYLIFWAWKSQSVYDFLTWLREFNSGVAENDRVSFYGLDVQYSTYDADRIVRFFELFDPETALHLSRVLLPYKNIQLYYGNGVTNSDVSLIDSGIKIALETIHSRSDEIKEKIGEANYKVLVQLGRHLEQTSWLRYQIGIQNGLADRDPFMAENALWVVTEMHPGAKAVLWAHNGHIADDPSYYGKGSLGSGLRDALKHRYRNLGFSFSSGRFHATNGTDGLRSFSIEAEPLAGSVNQLFRLAGHPVFALWTDDLPLKLQSWMDEKHPFLSIGSVYLGKPENHYLEVSAGLFFDAIIYIDQTQASLLR